MLAFTVDWFSHNIPVWTELFDSLGWLKSSTKLRVLEVGSWEGRSACWLLQHVCCSPESSLVCVDNWGGAEQYGSAAEEWGLSNQNHSGAAVLQRFRNNVEAVHGTDRVTVLQQPSWAALSTLMHTGLETFDVVYIDGSHVPQDVLTDATMAWKLLKNGGIIIFDGWCMTATTHV